MSLSLAEKFSGTVLNQNVVVSDPADYASGTSGLYRQEFFLPADYRRGTESGELRYPDLSGFQLLVQVASGCAQQASFEYTIQYQVFGLGWITAATGIAIGAPTDGKTWITAYFDEPVEIDQTKAGARWRINFSGRSAVGQPQDVPVTYTNGEANVYGNRVVADLIDYVPFPFVLNGVPAFLYHDAANAQTYFSYQQGIQKFWFSSPNPLALPTRVKASTQADVPLSGSGGEASFCFRVLATVGDDGTDFLGNRFRSVVSRNKADNISTALGADRDSFWLSKPNPSKFAVENLYFDVRKPGSITYGRANFILSPGFENSATTNYATFNNGVGTVTLAVIAGGHTGKGVRVTKTVGASDQAGLHITDAAGVPIAQAVGPWTVSAWVKGPVGRTGSIKLAWTRNAVGESTTAAFTFTGIWQRVSVSTTIPNGTITATDITLWLNAAVVSDFFDADEFMAERTSTLGNYFDGNSDGFVWSGVPFGSISYELIPPSTADVSSVTDRVLIDPITPGAYFSIYYSDEGDPGANETAWENKLWTRVPQTYRMERREIHVLPEPVKAKYLKIEFSHLQAKHYAPGQFQQPIRYKKHPKWVLDYFLARVQADQTNPFLAERVAVIYDAIDLAYNYYLDDLGQEPQTTVDVNNAVRQQVVSFLSDRSDVSDRIDVTTLSKIDLTLDSFRQHPALRGSSASLLADYARSTVDFFVDYPTEQRTPAALDTADVSSLNRDRVVIEQNFPVMFFFLTCRHAYREVEAKLSYDRAYFVGVRELSFLRDNYMTAFDTATYIEPASDTENIERNEFE